ncbi:MAG: hypothetical protein R3D01_01230 [Hyphomicrobiales bacterium]
MLARSLLTISLLGVCLASFCGSAAAQDADICLVTAERISNGEDVSAEDKAKGHEACQRALSATASVLQKYQFQEADFEILGTRPNN